MSSRTYEVCFKEQRLGMMLQNASFTESRSEDSQLLEVEVRAFTEYQGVLGAAELSGQIQVGDIVTRVDDRSTHGLDFAGVLDLVVGTERPVTVHFERRSATTKSVQPVQREKHHVWAGAETMKKTLSDPDRGTTCTSRNPRPMMVTPDNTENRTCCAADGGCSIS